MLYRVIFSLFHARITRQTKLLADIAPFLLTCLHCQQLFHTLVAVTRDKNCALHLMRGIAKLHIFSRQLLIQAKKTLQTISLVFQLALRQLLRRQAKQIIYACPNVPLAQSRNLSQRLLGSIRVQAQLLQLHVADAAIKIFAKLFLIKQKAVIQARNRLLAVHGLFACGALAVAPPMMNKPHSVRQRIRVSFFMLYPRGDLKRGGANAPPVKLSVRSCILRQEGS